MQVVVIAGRPAPGSRLRSLIEHRGGRPAGLGLSVVRMGLDPEFRETGARRLGYAEEQDFAYENLVLVTNNYGRHGFERLILTDLPPRTPADIAARFPDHSVVVVTIAEA